MCLLFQDKISHFIVWLIDVSGNSLIGTENVSCAFSDSAAYAHYVFNTFDQDHNGSISFEVS